MTRRNRSRIFSLLLLLVLFGGAVGHAIPAEGDDLILVPSQKPIPKEYFGMHIHKALSGTPWPSISFGTLRLWDTYTAWPWLEPNKGDFRFHDLGKLVDLASSQGAEVILPLGLSPAWASARPAEKSSYLPGFAAEPKHIRDWTNYVYAVGKEFKGRIRYYQLWNEPNLLGFYSGTQEKLLELAREAYKTLKEVDTSNVVISSPGTGAEAGTKWLDEFLTQGGGDSADVIGFHFYVAQGGPEDMVPLIQKVSKIMSDRGVGNKPLWNTESGWFSQGRQLVLKPEGTGLKSRVLDFEEGVAFVARSFILNWAAGVERFCWYAWDNRNMGLTEADGKTWKPAAAAYAHTYGWLIGATMKSCRLTKEGTWVCELSRGNGYSGWILWHPAKSGMYRYSPNWKIVQARRLDGTKESLIGVGAVKIGPQPVLIENKAR